MNHFEEHNGLKSEINEMGSNLSWPNSKNWYCKMFIF